MSSRLVEIFQDQTLIQRIQQRLPRLFQIAASESSRAGKIGMEVGSIRERILIALLIYKFGEENMETDIPITEAEVDVRLFGKPISVKTVTGGTFSGVKLIWTVDAQKIQEFFESYRPSCDILLARIHWGGTGGLYYLPVESQLKVLEAVGRHGYIKPPKAGTNPRGIEITGTALERLVSDSQSRTIEINWQPADVEYDCYRRWVDLWREEYNG